VDANVEVGLAMRILHGFFTTYLFKHGTCNYMYNLFEGHRRRPTPKEAIACCLQVAAEECPAVDGAPARTGVLLLVDQVAWLYHEMEAKGLTCNLLEVIGGLLDAFPPSQLNVVVTTVDTCCTARLATSTTHKRDVVYAPLSPLPQEVGEAALLAAWHKKLRSSGTAATALPAALPHYMRVAVSYACGDSYTLQLVKNVWLEDTRGGTEEDKRLAAAVDAANQAAAAADAAQQAARLSDTPEAIAAARDAVAHSNSMQGVALNQLRTRVCQSHFGFQSVNKAHIAAALAGRALPLDDPLPGDDKHDKMTLRMLIAKGTDASDMPVGAAAAVIPRVTMYQMQLYTRWGGDGSSYINQLASYAMYAADSEGVRGKWVVMFVEIWMRLVAAMLQRRSLAEMWHVEGVAADSALAAPLQLADYYSLAYKTHAVKLGVTTRLEVDTVHTFAATTHPGCDFAYVMYTSYGQAAAASETAAKALAGAERAVNEASAAAVAATVDAKAPKKAVKRAAKAAAAAEATKWSALEAEIRVQAERWWARNAAKRATTARAAAATGIKIVVGCLTVLAGHAGAHPPPDTIPVDNTIDRRVAGVETVGGVARSLAAVTECKQAIKQAVAEANGVLPADVEVVYIHVAGGHSLYASAAAKLPPNPTREQLAEYMREAEVPVGDDLVRLSAAGVDAFGAAMVQHEHAIIVDSTRFATALSPTLASYGQFMLRLMSEAAAAS